MGPKTTPSLISKGGYQIPPPPLGGGEIDTPWEVGLKVLFSSLKGFYTYQQVYFIEK